MRCPRCDEELSGTPPKCSECRGCWIVKSKVPRVVAESTATAVGESKINCPECHAQMHAIALHDVHLDRCSDHGVWFDIGEVTDVLRAAGTLRPDETAREDRPSKKERADEDAEGVGTAVLEIAGALWSIVS